MAAGTAGMALGEDSQAANAEQTHHAAMDTGSCHLISQSHDSQLCAETLLGMQAWLWVQPFWWA